MIGRSGSRSNVSGMIASSGATPLQRRQEDDSGAAETEAGSASDLVSIGINIIS